MIHMLPLTDGVTEQLLTACGYKYCNGYYTPNQFEEKYGFPPPAPFFRINRNNLVIMTEEAEAAVQLHFERVRHNFRALGVRA